MTAPNVSSAADSLDKEEVRQVRELLKYPLPELTPSHMTYAQFLDWLDEDTVAEWVDGEIVMPSPASSRHQKVAGFLEAIMRIYAEEHGIGTVLSAPFQMKIEQGREPDLLFVATANLDRLQETFLDGPADLVVEIISPESYARDRGEKYVEYEEGGVPEYWLIDPQRRRAEFYQLDDEGRYQIRFSGQEGRYDSRVLSGLWIQVAWLWQEPLPKVMDVLRELALI